VEPGFPPEFILVKTGAGMTNIDQMRIYIKAIPRSSQNKVEKLSEGEYRVRLTAPPVDGKANEALIKILAEHFGVAKSFISIVGGKSMSRKIVDVEGANLL